MKKIIYHGGRFGKNTFWFSSSPRVAGSYGKITWINQIPQFDDYETYEIELKNPFVVNAKEAYYYEIKTPTKMKNDWSSSTVDTDGIVEWAKNNGYDSVIIKNVIEGHGCSDVADEYVLFDKNFKEIEKITERLEELTDGVYATNSAYDVINFMKNKPKAVRIVWDNDINYYFLGDAFNYIHEDIMEEAFYQGFYPDLIDSTEARDKVENFGVILFAFYPTQNHKQDIEKSGDGYTRKYTYDFGTIYAHEVTPFEDCPLYQILGEPISKESIFEDFIIKTKDKVIMENLISKLNKIMKPTNNQYWKGLAEDMGAMGAAPCPTACGPVTNSGCTVNGIPVEGQSVKEYNKKKKKSKKHEEACKPLFNPYEPTEEDKDFATVEKRVTPEEMLDWIDETFDPSWILVTTVQNSRELMKISVCYDTPGHGMLHNMKIEYLDVDGETVIDEVDEEDFTIEECIEELQNIFRTHKPVDVEMYEDFGDEHIGTPEHEDETDIKAILMQAQAEENVAVSSYLNKANKCKKLGNERLEKLFRELADDETVHIGCLDAASKFLDIDDVEKLMDGEEEAVEILTNSVNDDIEDVVESLLNEDFNEAYEQITELIAKQLDKMNFEFANTNEIIYKKEGDYKYLFKFDNEIGIIKIKVLKDDEVLVEREWTIDEEDDITPIFEEIESIYGQYGL